MDEKRMYDAEKNELNKLIDNGVEFEVDRTIYVRQDGILGFVKRKISKKETLKFVIHEPTLSVLDILSAEQIELKIDENIMSSDIGVQEAKKLVAKHGKRMARIVAIAVLGQDYLIQRNVGGGIRYEKDDIRLNELVDILFHNVKPSKLFQLTVLVNTISNLGDFMNSIRLMSAARTTMPILVEESKEV